MIGPIVGGLLYIKFGYMYPFLLIALICFIVFPLIKVLVPKKGDYVEKEPVEEGSATAKQGTLRNYMMILGRPRISMVLLVFLLVNTQYIYLEPIMALRLVEQYGLPLWMSNLFFALIPIGYMLGTVTQLLILGVCKVKVVPQKQVIVCALLMVASILLSGPSILLPNELGLMVVGLFGQGFFGILQTLPLLPLVHSQIQNEFGAMKAARLTDSTSGIYAIA